MIERSQQSSLKRWTEMLIVFSLSLLAVSCAAGTSPPTLSSPSPASAPGQSPAAITKAAWEIEWQKSLKQLKKKDA